MSEVATGGEDTASHHAPATARQRAWRRVPRLVWAITALHISLMAMASVIYPTFMGYDEAWHVDMVWSYYHGDGLYGPGERHMDRGVAIANSKVPFPTRTAGYAQVPIDPRGDRPSLDALDDGDRTPSPRPNQMVQHPPLYYLTEAVLLRAVPWSGSLGYDQQVWLMRLFSILMVAPVPLLAWATARRLVGDGSVALTASALTVTLPGLSRVGGSVNNDNLLILLVAGLMLMLARVTTGDLSRRTGLVVGTLTALALLTKGLALALPVPVALAYGVAWLRHGRRAAAPLVLAALVAAGGAWWWVRNLVLYGAVQPAGVGPDFFAQELGQPNPGGTITAFTTGFFHRLSARFWGGFGIFDYPNLPHWVGYAWLVTVALAMAGGVCFGIGASWGRLAAAVFALPAVAFLGIIFYGSYDNYRFNMRIWAGIQGRYLYPTLTGIAVLAALCAARLARRHARLLPLAVLAAGLLTQAWAFRLLLDNWWAPTRSGDSPVAQLREALGGVLRWSPWPRPVTMLPFALVAVCAVAVLALAAWQVRSPAGTLATVSAVGAGDAAGPTTAEPAAEPPLPEPSPGPESADQRR